MTAPPDRRSHAPSAPSSADAVLEGLDPEQRTVATSPPGALCVLAGAGTGKTRAITHRIAYGVLSGAYPPPRVLALTFTARAAGEMRTRLRALGVEGVQARTFHAAALRQLHYFWPQAVGGAAPEVLPQKVPVVAEAAGRLRMSFDRAGLRDLAAEIEWAKVSMLTTETYAGAARDARREAPGVDHTAMARLLAVYEDVKAERHVIDFEDVLLLTVGILQDREDIAAAVRAQYRHFVVDEYQDVNDLQQRLLDLWRGGRHDVCVVGDPAQTIYTFTGASPRHLLEFPRAHPDAQVVRLVRNYRSSPQVVALANLLLRDSSGAARGSLRRGSTATDAALRLQAQGPPGPAPTLRAAPDDQAEGEAVAAAVAELLAGGAPASRIAILFRTNGQSEVFEAALAGRGIPYLVRGGERFFARAEVRQAMLLLRGAARAEQGSRPLPEIVQDVLVGAGWTREPPVAGGAARERWESLAALAALADDLAQDQGAGLADLVRELDERAAAQHAPTVEGVTLASLHAAKGLEWDTVFVAGCSDGLIPIALAETSEAIEEERRLLYVGMTRARRDLRLSWARTRAPGGRPSRRPSRFLDATAAILGEDARTTAHRRGRSGRVAGARAPRRAAPAVCRTCGGDLATAAQRKTGRCDDCPPTYRDAVFEGLRTWRRAVAREAGVPAYVVFTDATLTAIAEREPTTPAELSAISGVGTRKLDLYGEQVLAVVGGSAPGDVLQNRSGASELT
jgi:DNA helicase-2/ATP-dependent DNA helicase PcrA